MKSSVAISIHRHNIRRRDWLVLFLALIIVVLTISWNRKTTVVYDTAVYDWRWWSWSWSWCLAIILLIILVVACWEQHYCDDSHHDAHAAAADDDAHGTVSQ